MADRYLLRKAADSSPEMRYLFAVLAVALSCGTEAGTRPFIPEVLAQGTGEVFRGTFSPSGTEFYFFRKVTPGEGDYRVFRTTYESDAWGSPEMLPLGDGAASTMYPVVSPDEQLLVMTSYRDIGDGFESANLWASTRQGGDWDDPKPLLGVSTPENYDASPWFGPSGDLRFTSTSPDWSTTWYRKSVSTQVPFEAWEEDPLWPALAAGLVGHHLWSGILHPTGTLAVAEVSVRNADGTLGPSDLWVARADGDDWGSLHPLSSEINTEGNENFPTFTPDGTSLVFVRDFAAFFLVDVTRVIPNAQRVR